MPRLTRPTEVNDAPKPDVNTETKSSPAKKRPPKAGRPKQEALALTGTPVSLQDMPGMKGEVGAACIQIPTFCLVNPDSKVDKALPGMGAAGNFFLANEISLGTELDVIICSTERRFQESKAYDPSNLPKDYATTAEANGDGAFNLADMAILDMLVLVDADSEDAAFGAAHDDEHAYIPCRWYLTGRNYGSVFKALCTSLVMKQDSVPYVRTYHLEAKLSKNKYNKTLYQAFLRANQVLLSNGQLEIARALGAGQ